MDNIATDLLSEQLVLIGKQRRQGRGERIKRYYAGNGEVLREVNMGSVDDLDDAVNAANAAHPHWAGLPPSERRDLMLKTAALLKTRSESLAQIGAIDAGIPIATVRGFVRHASEWLAYYAGWIDKAAGEVVPADGTAFNYVRYEPYGVIGVISPSNSTISAMVLGPLLAAGNCAVVKTSEFTSNVMAAYLQVFLDAGFPPGVVNCVPGGQDVGQALVQHPGIHSIHFTGSCSVGAEVGALAATLHKPVGMELGGKSANIVFPDADIGIAAEVATRALVRQSGQSCVAGTRIIAHRSIMDQLVKATIERTRAQKMGDPLQEDTVVGPVVSQASHRRIRAIIEQACSLKQGKLVLGDEEQDAALRRGYFINPTIFTDVNNASPLAQNEIFGPVIAFIPFESEQEAVALANDSRFGLAAYIQTSQLGQAHRVAAQLDVGTVWVNGAPGVLPGGPFGGVKHSGYGRIGGADGLKAFSRPKNVWLHLP